MVYLLIPLFFVGVGCGCAFYSKNQSREVYPVCFLGMDGRLRNGVEKAREKHPKFCRNGLHFTFVLLEEVLELLFALAFQTWERVQEEATDVCAVVYRLVAGDMRKENHVPWWTWLIKLGRC